MRPSQRGTWKRGMRHRNEKHNYRQQKRKQSEEGIGEGAIEVNSD